MDRDEALGRLEAEGVVAPDEGGRVRLTRASEIEPEAVRWAWEGRVPLRSLSLVVGRWEVNKTTLGLELSARVTRGRLAGDLRGVARNVLVVSSEDSRSTTLRPRLEAAGADLDRCFFLDIADEDYVRGLAIPHDVEALRAVVDAEGIAVVMIDPLLGHLDAEINSHRDGDVRRALGPLARVADETGVSVLGVVHVNKAPSGELFARVMGSVGVGASARSILVVERDPKEPEDSPYRVVLHGKCNVAPHADPLRFEVETRRFTNPAGDTIETAGLVWRGVAEGITARDVLGERTSEPTERDEAVAWLTDLLADGEPVAYRDIERLASEAGTSRATLHRARREAGVEVIRDDSAQGRPSSWRLSSQSLSPKGETKENPSPARGKPPSTGVSSHVSEIETERGNGPASMSVEEVATALDADIIDDDGWRYDAEVEPCEHCTFPCTMRSPKGRCVHRSCIEKART